MIFSDESIEVLENFCKINPSMVMDWQDNLLAVSSPAKTVLAAAVLPESWDDTWSIYDVPQLLSLVKMLDSGSATATVKGRAVVLADTNTEIEYKMSPSNLIVHPPVKELKFDDPFVKFVLPKNVLQRLNKGANTLQNSHIRITASSPSEPVLVETYNKDNSSINTMKTEFAGTVAKPGQISFKIEFFKLLEDDYLVQVTDKFAYFEAKNKAVRYWIVKD